MQISSLWGNESVQEFLAATIKSMGFSSQYFDPADEKFPIITDANFNNAKILPMESKKMPKQSCSSTQEGNHPYHLRFSRQKL